jgi:hypothetical protein
MMVGVELALGRAVFSGYASPRPRRSGSPNFAARCRRRSLDRRLALSLHARTRTATQRGFPGFRQLDIQVYKAFVENDSFKRFVGDMVYELATRQ